MTKKVFLAHNACLNAGYDLNVLRSGIQRAGSSIVETPEEADEIVFSGCSVREHWVDDAINQLTEANGRAPNARIVVTGCIANTRADKVRDSLKTDRLAILPLKDVLSESTSIPFSEVDRMLSQSGENSFESDAAGGLHNLRTRVGAAKSNVLAELEEEDRRHGTQLVRTYRQTTKGFVFYDENDPCEMITVTRSCLYQCSFCNIPQGRGEYTSVALSDVLSKAREAVTLGKYHLVLIGDEVGNYGKGTGGPGFKELVQAILDISPSIRLSIRYIEPKPFLKNFQEILAWAKAGRLQLLYLSLQSGSSRILKLMRRGYDIDRVAQALRQFRGDTSTVLYGNWLVGFPGESDQDFEQTQQVVRALNFHINVAIPFSARPDTPAYGMEQLDSAVVSARVEALTETAADLKCELMRPLMECLQDDRRAELLGLIREGERDQYAAPIPNPRRPIPLIVQTT
ncbi:TPA: radical SAM protein [Stenotrophomonas maltophilia]|uniref:radical SAM protein n=1 Tax=Stenotrophomonas maltophilia TaxID=40324 RepID=UPI0031B8E3A4|nr:radical SAM protein [Stenotrophomonas maltophilia]HDS1559838.1 radical SAM protein [Stenotrophomonas maltophilia]